jgi:hypothetical protein
MAIQKITLDGNTFILSTETPKQGDCYICIVTDSLGPKLSPGTRLETDATKGSHKNCIKVLATDHKGLNIEGCPTLEGFTLNTKS